MGRNPFKEKSTEYLERCKDRYAESTLKVIRRRLNRLERELNLLKNKGMIETTNPGKMKPEDIRALCIFLRSKTMSNGKQIQFVSISKDLNDLNNLCQMCGNNCVETMYRLFPETKSRINRKRLSAMTNDEISAICRKASSVPDEDFRRIRAYGVIGLYIGCGMRTVELQHFKADNMEMGQGLPMAHIDFVKGQDSYGSERISPMLPEFEPMVERYLEARRKSLNHKDKDPEYYVYGLDDLQMLSDKTVRQIRQIAEEDSGISFDGRKCRRTYAQQLKNRGVPIEVISKVMGHSTTKTTETFYGRILDSDAAKTIEKILSG